MLPSLRFPTLLGAGCWMLGTAVPAPAQFNTPTINGIPNDPAGEYGSTVLGENHGSTESGPEWYMTWDEDFLYVGITSANLGEGAIVCIDANPILPVNGGTNADGNLATPSYDNVSYSPLPFRADFFTYFKSGYHDFRRADGSGGWTSPTALTMTYAENGVQGHREIAIPWDNVTGGQGRPSSFNWFGYITSETGFVYASVPTKRLNGQQFSGTRDPWYFTVDSTENGTSTYPFEQTSFTYVETGDTFFTSSPLLYGQFGDLTFGRANVFLERDPNAVLTAVRDLVITAGDFRLGSPTQVLEITRDVHLLGGQLSLGTQVGGDLRVGRDFRISPGGVLQGNDRQVEFFGTQSGVIGGDFTGNNHIDYMRMNKTSGAEMLLEGNLEVSVRLWLTIGALDTNGNLLRILFSGADSPNTGVLRGVSDAGYVRGTLQRRIGMTQGIRQFPVGTNPAAPLLIEFELPGPSQIGEIAVSTTEELISPFNADNMIARTWQVDVVQPLGTYEAALEFQYDASDIEGAVAEADLRAAKRYSAGSFHTHASTWLDPQPAVETDGFSVNDTSNNQSLEGLWVLTTAPDSLLRVELVGLAAVCEGVGSPVTIEWETAAEFMNAGFNVYRVEEGDTLRRINAFPIPAQGSETHGAQYTFVDAEVIRSGEQRAYMLEDVELSGAQALHGPVTVGPLQAASSDVADWSLYAW